MRQYRRPWLSASAKRQHQRGDFSRKRIDWRTVLVFYMLLAAAIQTRHSTGKEGRRARQRDAERRFVRENQHAAPT